MIRSCVKIICLAMLSLMAACFCFGCVQTPNKQSNDNNIIAHPSPYDIFSTEPIIPDNQNSTDGGGNQNLPKTKVEIEDIDPTPKTLENKEQSPDVEIEEKKSEDSGFYELQNVDKAWTESREKGEVLDALTQMRIKVASLKPFRVSEYYEGDVIAKTFCVGGRDVDAYKLSVVLGFPSSAIKEIKSTETSIIFEGAGEF